MSTADLKITKESSLLRSKLACNLIFSNQIILLKLGGKAELLNQLKKKCPDNFYGKLIQSALA